MFWWVNFAPYLRRKCSHTLSMLRFPTLRNAQNFLHHKQFLRGCGFCTKIISSSPTFENEVVAHKNSSFISNF